MGCVIQDIKALVVVLGLTLPLWHLAKRVFAPLAAPGDFERRRNVWLALTVLGLLAPNIWIYTVFALPIMLWAARRESNPVALYILLFFVIPNTSIRLPSIGVDLFDISHQRLLALGVLIPAYLQARRERFQASANGSRVYRGLDATDWFLVFYVLLTLVLPAPHDSVTNTMRRTFLAVLDIGLLFAVWSRLSPRVEAFRDVMGAWLLAAIMMSPLAMFETARAWLLYADISHQWGNPNAFAYLMRGSLLRAQVTAGHSLTLGIWLATAWALYLGLQSRWDSRWLKLFFGAVLLGGLAASLARGAWISAFFAFVVFYLLDPRGALPAVKAMGGFAVIALLFLSSPIGDDFLALLPFVGSVDSENVIYRKRLLEVSLGLIARNPWFGDPFVLSQMESLRQGQGIIDLVNGYLTVALFNGLVGLSLFVGFLLIAVWRARAVWAWYRKRDVDRAIVGASLVAATMANMLFIATAGIDPMIYMLVGLLSSYIWMQRDDRRRDELARRVQGPPVPAPPPTQAKRLGPRVSGSVGSGGPNRRRPR